MIFAAATTLDNAASAWVEPAVLVIGPAILGLLAWTLLAWVRRSAREAVATRELSEVSDACTALTARIAAQEQRCTACHRGIDDRLAHGDTALAILRQSLEHLQATIEEIRQMVFVLYQSAGLTPRPARNPLQRQRTNPIPGSGGEGDDQ